MKIAASKWALVKKKLIPYIFLFPAIILIITFEYLPTLSAFYYSFTEYHLITEAQWIGFDNYKGMIEDTIFWQALGNSLKYFMIMVPTLVVIPLFLAILINRKLPGIYFFRLVYYLPYITAMVAIAIIWRYLYNQAGLINSTLQMIGLDSNINWLMDPDIAPISISIMESWKIAGFYMLIYLAGLQGVSKDLIDAAKIDGASFKRIIWHIYLPQLRPITAVVLIMSTLVSVQMFTSIYIMTGGGPLNSTLSLPLYIYQKAFVELDMGYATAMGIVLWIILMILTIINYKLSRGGQGL